jgi:signal transduction histidine kinase
MSIAKILVIAKEHWIALDLKYRLLRLGYEANVTVSSLPDLIQAAIDNIRPDLVLAENAREIIDAAQAANVPVLCFNSQCSECSTYLPCLANPHDDVSLKTAIRETLRQLHHNQQQSELLYAVNHELRSPLSTILVTFDRIELIEQESLSARSLQKLEHLSLARNSVTQIVEILDRASFLCRTRKLNWKPTLINLQVFCRNLIAEYQHSFYVELIFASEIRQINFDQMILRQILSNLLNNAVKYSNSGSKVQLILDRTGDNLIVQVRDFGIGIPECDRALIFKPLYRGSNVQGIPGSGMGLAIVQQLVLTCQGSITVKSASNQGSTFTVSLPLQSPTLDR